MFDFLPGYVNVSEMLNISKVHEFIATREVLDYIYNIKQKPDEREEKFQKRLKEAILSLVNIHGDDENIKI